MTVFFLSNKAAQVAGEAQRRKKIGEAKEKKNSLAFPLLSLPFQKNEKTDNRARAHHRRLLSGEGHR